MDLVGKVEEIREKARGRSCTELAELQLPLWSDPARAAPNSFIRSALFGVVGRGMRRYLNGQEIASLAGVTILFTGQRLDQGDFELWETILHLIRKQGPGHSCRTTSYELLQLMGKTDSGKSRTILIARMRRLVATSISIQTQEYEYTGSLLASHLRRRGDDAWHIEIDPRMAPLFGEDQYTLIDWSVRREITQPLAQWLHAFYSTHAEPFPMKVLTLHRLCGSENSDLPGFRRHLRVALQAVRDASHAHGQMFEFRLENDLVYVRRGPKAPPFPRAAKVAKTAPAPARRRTPPKPVQAV